MARSREEQIVERLAASGRVTWGGGKPLGSASPPRVRGNRAAEIVLEDRG